MRNGPVAELPRFRLRWLLDEVPERPAWIDDDEWVPSGDRKLYSEAKQGLYAWLNTLDSEGPVLLPAYVPGGVTWAVIAAGFDVRYYPVSSDLSLPVDDVSSAIREHDPAAVLFIHYFGFVSEGFDELVTVTRRHDAAVIEDCARGLFGRDLDGRLLGSVGDLAIFSLHKTLPMPNGGLSVSKTGVLPDASEIQREWQTLPRLGLLLAARCLGINTESKPHIKRPTDWDPSEVSPERPLSAPGPLSKRALTHCRPSSVQSAREGRYRALRALLLDEPKLTVLTPPVYDGAAPFGVAALAATPALRKRYLHDLHEYGLPCDVLTWPFVCRHEQAKRFSGAETLRSRLLVFPLHQQLDARDIGDIAARLSS